MDGAAGQPGRGADLHPVPLFRGVAERVRRTSWVGMVMRGVRCGSILVVYLGPRSNTSYRSTLDRGVALAESGSPGGSLSTRSRPRSTSSSRALRSATAMTTRGRRGARGAEGRSSQLGQRGDGCGTRVEKHEACSVPLRRVRADELREEFSTNSRPALRAASGRPPAALRPGSHTTVTGEPASPHAK